jgi:small subunit ribosomal protein S21
VETSIACVDNLLEQRVQVFVRDNNVEQALRILKRKMQREGVFREMRRRRFYEKPSDRASREKTEAIRRAHKQARKQAIRDGLIAAPTKKSADSRTSGAELRGIPPKTPLQPGAETPPR